MTREEAIQELQLCKRLIQQNGEDYLDERDIPLLDMAIEALSAEAVRGVGRYENAMQKLREMPKYLNGVKEKQITKVSANYTTKKPNNEVEQGNDVVVEPTDLISRADAIEELGEYFDHLKRIDKRGIKRIEPISLDCKGIINELPSADRPSGEWIIRDNGNKECSLCGHERQDGWDYFCGYCGAKMRSGGLYYADNRLTVEWKPVSEELPQSVGSYLVTCKGEHGFIYVDYDFWTVSDEFKYNRDNVIAWVPFLEPYKEGK